MILTMKDISETTGFPLNIWKSQYHSFFKPEHSATPKTCEARGNGFLKATNNLTMYT